MRVLVSCAAMLAIAGTTTGAGPAGSDLVEASSSRTEVRDLVKKVSVEKGLDPKLVDALVRVESGYNPAAVSRKGAMGLMQLMPATAEEVAGELGLPYSRARLTSEWEYNARLGSRYLANLQEQFGDSPVMIAAGYNAGPSRPSRWMSERGDPRKGEVDIVDWIEMIPFTETRNYVMRVTESIPVYRARLTGETGTVRFRDLLIGAPPFIRPVARGEVQGAAPGPAARLRPLARPGG